MCHTYSPLNKKSIIPYFKRNGYWYYFYAFHNSIIIEIPDSIFEKVRSVEIKIGDDNTPVNKTQMKCISRQTGLGKYALPESIYSHISVPKLAMTVSHWKIIRQIFIALIIIIFCSLIIYFYRNIFNHLFKIHTKLKKMISRKVNSCNELKIKYIKSSGLLFCRLSAGFSGRIRNGAQYLNELVSQKFVTAFKMNKRNFILKINIILFFYCQVLVLFFAYLLTGKFLNTFILNKFSHHIGFTDIMLIILFSALLSFLTGVLFFKIVRIPLLTRQKIKLMTVVIFIMWGIGEIGLRQAGTFKLPNEKNGVKAYKSLFCKDEIAGNLMVYPPYYFKFCRNNEFGILMKTNREGLCDQDYSYNKKDNEFRIIGLGDSFTQGVGTSPDSAWPRQLETILNICSKGLRYSVINAGIGGSDPFFYYKLLKTRLLKYHPDLVIYTFNQSDIDDADTRGGFERFNEDGTVQYKKGPEWEWLYASSFVARAVATAVFGYNMKLSHDKQENIIINETIGIYSSCFSYINKLCIDNGIGLVIVFHPQYGDILRGNFMLQPIIDWYKKNINGQYINLYDYYLEKEGINSGNIFQYYWENDRHHNGTGYSAFARGVKEELIKMGLINMNYVTKNR